MHVCTRTSTQARSHAQKFFVKIERKNINLEEYLQGLDVNNLEKDILFSDLDDDEEESRENSSINKEPQEQSSSPGSK